MKSTYKLNPDRTLSKSRPLKRRRKKREPAKLQFILHILLELPYLIGASVLPSIIELGTFHTALLVVYVAAIAIRWILLAFKYLA